MHSPGQEIGGPAEQATDANEGLPKDRPEPCSHDTGQFRIARHYANARIKKKQQKHISRAGLRRASRPIGIEISEKFATGKQIRG